MQGSGSAYPPEGAGPRRPGLFSRKSTPQGPPMPPGLDDLIASYQRGVEQRLEEGLRAIQQTAVSLMHEIAAEMWRASSGDVRDAQAQILSLISRDQTVRSLISHSDERFQALAVRTARLEDTIGDLAESTRALKEVLAKGAHALAEAANSPALRGVEEVRDELERIEEHIAQAFKHLAERDLALVDKVQSKVQEHGELVAQEIGRIVEAMEGYVQGGVGAMGQLAQRLEGELRTVREGIEGELGAVRGSVESELGRVKEGVEGHIASVQTHDEEVARALGQTVREQVEALERRIAEETRTLADAFKAHEGWVLRTTEAVGDRLDHSLDGQADRIDRSLDGQADRIADATRDAAIRVAQELNRTFETRVMGLAQLVRSDSEVLRDKLVEIAAAHDEMTARILEERLDRVAAAVQGATDLTVEQTVRRVGELTERAVGGKFDDVVTAIDRNMVRLADTLETELERVGQSVGQRAAEAADASVATHVSRTVERLDASIGAVERLRDRMERMHDQTEASVARHMDERIAALARMIRSDNRILAERLQQAAEQEPAKQALRAVKELQASLAAEIMERVDRRFAAMAEQLHRETQAMAESVAKSTEVLSDRIHQETSQMRETSQPGAELQEVIERMGDAMHAIATLSRASDDPGQIRID